MSVVSVATGMAKAKSIPFNGSIDMDGTYVGLILDGSGNPESPELCQSQNLIKEVAKTSSGMSHMLNVGFYSVSAVETALGCTNDEAKIVCFAMSFTYDPITDTSGTAKKIAEVGQDGAPPTWGFATIWKPQKEVFSKC